MSYILCRIFQTKYTNQQPRRFPCPNFKWCGKTYFLGGVDNDAGGGSCCYLRAKIKLPQKNIYKLNVFACAGKLILAEGAIALSVTLSGGALFAS